MGEIDKQHGRQLAFHCHKCMNDAGSLKKPEKRPVQAQNRASVRAVVSIPTVLDPKVFKAYDVRGIYPSELDEDGAYAIGRAYAEQFEPSKIAVGHDMRLSSPAMADAFPNGGA